MTTTAKIRTAFAAIAAILFLASPPPSLAAPRMRDFDRVGPSVKPVYLPAVGAPASVALGESLVSSYNVYSREALKLKEPIQSVGKGYRLTIPQGVLLLVGENHNGKFYQSHEPIDLKTAFGLGLESKTGGVFMPKEPDETPEAYWGESINVSTVLAPGVRYEFTTRESTRANPFRMELLYSGVFQNTLTLTYREFKDDMARPAFTQELKYDLSQGPEIGFRSARFRVLKATNTRLDYQVLSPLTP